MTIELTTELTTELSIELSMTFKIRSSSLHQYNNSILYSIFLVVIFLAGCSGITRYQMDLASDTAWELSVDDGSWRNIKVPGGGYNSDLQDQPLIDQEDVMDHVTYRRSVTIPEFGKEDVIKINFGGVNHGCEVYLDGKCVGLHVGPMMPFEVDITDYVEPGKEYELKVVSYPQWHYNYEVPHAFVYDEFRNHPDTKPDWVSEPGWATKFSYGITKSIRLVVLPGVYISDVFVQPSVTDHSLKYDVWIHNHTDQPKDVKIRSALSSWNDDQWDYPEFEPVSATISPGEIKKIGIGPVRWNLGQESYWWPNKPFSEEYKAKLHNLTITVFEKNKVMDSRIQRFGFVEWTEGPTSGESGSGGSTSVESVSGGSTSEESTSRGTTSGGPYYYMVNGVRINQVSDGTPEPAMSEYDCYSISPAFLPPTDSTLGCPETWKRYMRLGICANRIHQSTPTEYMMDAADETGFMLIPETAIRGCQEQKWHNQYLPQAVMELAQTCRNHPSVCRYSLQNEADSAWIPVLIDSIKGIDPLHPLVFEDNQINHPARIESKTGHAYAMLHYVDYPKPAQIITGMGEYAWHWADRSRWGPVLPSAEGGLEEFIYYGGDMRRWDIVYFAGWDFINYWPNFLEGMSYAKHAWKQSCYHKDRIDGENGWNSPVVTWMQKYFHPYLVLDLGIHEMNGPDSDLSDWPEHSSSYSQGDLIERDLEIFNDGLKGNQMALMWETHWDSPDGELVDSGRIENLRIEPGFHQSVKLKFQAPEADVAERRLNVILRSELEGKEVFKEEDIYFLIRKRRN